MTVRDERGVVFDLDGVLVDDLRAVDLDGHQGRACGGIVPRAQPEGLEQLRSVAASIEYPVQGTPQLPHGGRCDVGDLDDHRTPIPTGRLSTPLK